MSIINNVPSTGTVSPKDQIPVTSNNNIIKETTTTTTTMRRDMTYNLVFVVLAAHFLNDVFWKMNNQQQQLQERNVART
jgi:hypothetical protein